MKLYCSANSPFARKVRVVLAELGIAHEEVRVDVYDAPPEFERANPNLRIPCLLEGERALFESNVIVDYLLRHPDAAAGRGDPPLVGSLTRPERQWEDRMVLETIEGLLDSAIMVYQLDRDGITAEQSGTVRRQLQRVQSELDWLEERVGEAGFVPGVLSIQDLNLTIALQWLDFRQPAPWRGRPHLEALVARHEGRPTLQATRPGT